MSFEVSRSEPPPSSTECLYEVSRSGPPVSSPESLDFLKDHLHKVSRSEPPQSFTKKANCSRAQTVITIMKTIEMNPFEVSLPAEVSIKFC